MLVTCTAILRQILIIIDYLGVRLEVLARREKTIGGGEYNGALGGGRKGVDGGVESLVLLENHIHVLEEDKGGFVQLRRGSGRRRRRREVSRLLPYGRLGGLKGQFLILDVVTLGGFLELRRYLKWSSKNNHN